MKILILIVLAITSQHVENSSYLTCNESFQNARYEEAIKHCNKAETNNKVESILLISNLFLEVTPERLDHILYNGMDDGYLAYKYTHSKPLYTNIEKLVLEKYFGQIKSSADQGNNYAQLLTAKIFHINELIIKPHLEKILTSETADNEKTAKKKFYYPYLEKYLISSPNDMEALFLLGKEGIKREFPLTEIANKEYYSIINQAYFEYLQKAADLGNINADNLLKAVKKWDIYINELESKAQLNNTNAAFELGHIQLGQSGTNPTLLNNAIENFQKAGSRDALNQLLYIFTSKKPDQDKYTSTLKQLIELNDTEAMVMLGDYYLCQNQNDKAIKLYKKAKDSGDYSAQYAIEDMKAGGIPSSSCIEF